MGSGLVQASPRALSPGPARFRGHVREAISPSLTSHPIRGKDLEKQAGCSCRVEGVAGGAQEVESAEPRKAPGESPVGQEILLLLTRASCPIPQPPPLLAGPSLWSLPEELSGVRGRPLSPSLLEGISQAALAFSLH